MEITKEIKAKVVAQYIGQDVVIPKNYKFDGYRTDAEKRELVGIYEQSIKLLGISCFYPVEDFKLILKPLSDITSDDAVEVQKIIGFKSKTKFPQFNTIINSVSPEDAIEIYQFLQSKGYDMPHYLLGGKTLEEAGLAIYK